MPLEAVVQKLKKIAAYKKSPSTQQQVQQVIPVITTPEITCASSSAGVVPQQRSQKRQRTPPPTQVGELKFVNRQEAEYFFRVGKNKAAVSPCVIVGNLDVKYPLVYEEWQKHRSGQNGVTHYRCRRQRGKRTKSKRSYVASSKRVRQPDQKQEYIGCDCPARYRLQVMADGSVSVKFYGHHNHDVQKQYAVRFLNPTTQVGELKFVNRQEAEYFFRVGKNKAAVSPCVIVGNLDVKYPLVYEEWQKHRSGQNGVTHYRCRRQRGKRTKSKRSYVASSKRVRQPDQKQEYIGCDCPARYRLQVMADGSVSVKFYGHHNHDVQKQYAVRFLNPITSCFRIREIVDSKLLAGVQKLHGILTGVLSEMFKCRETQTKSDEEVLRCYHMAFALTKRQIRNRRDQLGLNIDQLAHK